MFTSIERKIARIVLTAVVILIASGVPVFSIAQAAPVCAPSIPGC
jgi:hypothetical protein